MIYNINSKRLRLGNKNYPRIIVVYSFNKHATIRLLIKFVYERNKNFNEFYKKENILVVVIILLLFWITLNQNR